MALIRWEPARELQSVQSEINRLFNTLFDTPTPAVSGGQRRWIPAMDLVENDSHFVLRADLPGLTERDVKIELQDSVLTISGERRTEHATDGREGYVRLERASGAFSRSLTLPEGVDAANVSATFTNGVLEVQVPKPEVRKPQKIEIAVNKATDTIEGAESAERPADPALASTSA